MIKFRVWDKKNRKFYDDFAITGDGELLEPSSVETEYSVADMEDYIIQKFTGLLDKNGREIYVGDIVTVAGHLNVVRFGLFKYYDREEKENKTVGFYLACSGGVDCCGMQRIPTFLYYWGNICESRELIEKEYPELLEK